MEYFGIDTSTKAIHVVWLDSNGLPIHFYSCGSAKKNQDERFYELARSFDGLVFSKDDFGAVEKPLFVQSAPATIGLAQVVGAVKLSLFNKHIEFSPVGNTTWKKIVVGKGNVKKEQIKQFTIEKFKMQENLVQDFYDACCISYWAYIFRNSIGYAKENNAIK